MPTGIIVRIDPLAAGFFRRRWISPILHNTVAGVRVISLGRAPRHNRDCLRGGQRSIAIRSEWRDGKTAGSAYGECHGVTDRRPQLRYRTLLPHSADVAHHNRGSKKIQGVKYAKDTGKLPD